MASSWTDSLYLTILKNGTMSLRLNKRGCDGSWWSPSINNIKTASEFLSAFRSIEWIDHWEVDDVLRSLYEHHPIFAVLVERELQIERLDEDIEPKIEEIILPVLRNAVIDQPAGGINKKVLHDKVREFIKSCFLKTGSSPKGEHEIGGRTVKFKS